VSATAVARAAALNRDCDCVGTDVATLRHRLADTLAEAHVDLFSTSPVFVARESVKQMQSVIDAVERLVALPGYRSAVLARAPDIARQAPSARGVFLGFDFHITPAGPRLIEINTNAGGPLLNAAARGAQVACCPSIEDLLHAEPKQAALEDQIFAMFLEEWRRARGHAPLTHVAIVDDDPVAQFLYPEFVGFQRLFEARGVRASIVDASRLQFDGRLRIEGEAIDLVYNRCTDFYLAATEHAALAEAYAAGVVITPHPHSHALYADKRNLVRMTNKDLLREVGAADEDISTLSQGIPLTREVVPGTDWWQQRRQWFFKPAAGFGSRGSYRGDKMTRGVFEHVMRGGYVAQALTPPGERHRAAGGAYKVDLRCYVYDGEVQQIAARLYQGQTTNFRTRGGGFAPVYLIPSGHDSGCER
jgi:hypothetical protein